MFGGCCRRRGATQVTSIARALAEEYKALLPPGAEPAGTDAEAAASRHKALIFELNRSGKYAQMRDSLKTSVVSVGRAPACGAMKTAQ